MKPRARLVSLVTADVLSTLGSSVSIVALPWLVLVSTGSAARMGVVAAAEMIPYLLTSLLGPPLADRIGLRRTSIAADAGSAVVMAAVAAAPALDFGLLLVLVAVAGAMRGIGDRVKHAMLRPVAVAAGAPLLRVTSAYDGLSRGALLLGAPLGGLLIFWFGVSGALWVDAASFAACAVIVALLVPLPATPTPTPPLPAPTTPAPAAAEGYLAALGAGFRHLRRDRTLLAMFGIVFTLNVFSNAGTAVFIPLWVADVLRSPIGLGLILGAFSAGALLGNVTFTVLGPRVPRHLAFTLGALISGAPRLFALGLSDALPLVMSVAFVSGIGIAAVNPILGVALYERVPEALQTRLIGIAGAVAFAGLPLGALAGGWAATTLGLRPAVLTAATVCLVATIGMITTLRARRLEEPAPPPASPPPQRAEAAPPPQRAEAATLPQRASAPEPADAAREAADPYCLRPGESAALLRDHPWRRFVVLGDSVAEGLCEPVDGYPRLQWADRIAAELAAAELAGGRPGPAYLNLGRRGLRAREVRASQLDSALAFRPDLALVVCGGNDAFPPTFDEAAADAVDAELAAMVQALLAAGADVLTVGMFDVSHSPAVPDRIRAGLRERMRRLSAHTGRLADRLGTLHVHLTDHPLTADPSIYSGDGRHGSARSDAVAAAETVRRLGAHLALRRTPEAAHTPTE